MNSSIIPNLPSREARVPFVQNLEQWRNFAQRITKSPFVKAFLLERDGHECSWCKRVLGENKVVHHISYEHVCTFDRTIQIDTPTFKRSSRQRNVPDCESCKKDNNDRFISCMNKLALVHGYCNKLISEKHLSQSIEGRGFPR